MGKVKKRILVAYKAYPFCMANYFLRALGRRDDVEVYTVGEFSGQYIPWNNGMMIPDKYPNHVDIPLPPGMDTVPYQTIKASLPWHPDLVLNIDAGFHFSTKPDVPYAVVATDPHVLGDWYSKVRPLADFYFNMQPSYMKDGDILLPYAYDPSCHYADSGIVKTHDCTLIGLHYAQRNEWVARLNALGITVNYRIGDIYDEYRKENNKAWIGLNWSSLQDVTARVFEIMAMRLVPVINRLPGLDSVGFVDGVHYLGFSSMDEAIAQVQLAKNDKELSVGISNNAWEFVTKNKCTWDTRVQQILDTCGV